mmetsp:Transcript_12473/g.25464  ORF Transcript_12473/g.25464 Transcript_12473/m.25464 type:complete len:282 (-) Transcript_12473:3174-4019(-)
MTLLLPHFLRNTPLVPAHGIALLSRDVTADTPGIFDGDLQLDLAVALLSILALDLEPLINRSLLDDIDQVNGTGTDEVVFSKVVIEDLKLQLLMVAQHCVHLLVPPFRGCITIIVRLASQLESSFPILVAADTFSGDVDIRVESLAEHVGVLQIPALLDDNLHIDTREKLDTSNQVSTLLQGINSVLRRLHMRGCSCGILEEINRDASHQIVTANVIVIYVDLEAVEESSLFAPEIENLPVEYGIQHAVFLRRSSLHMLLSTTLESHVTVNVRIADHIGIS